MPLPSAMPVYDQTRIRGQRGDLDRPDLRHGEPGTWWNARRGDLEDFIFPEQRQVESWLLGGADPTNNAGNFVLTVTPIKTQTGTAGSDGLPPGSVTFPAPAPVTLAAAVQGLIDAAADGAELLDPADLNAWSQLLRYVTLSVGANPETLLVTALNTGATFNVTLTTPTGSTATQTIISAPNSSSIKVGFYVGIDRSSGFNGFNVQGQTYVKELDASVPPDDIRGPVMLGNGTEPVEGGWAFKEYKPANDMGGALYGDPLAYAELIVPPTDIKQSVYVRHTDGGDFLAGMAANQAAAEAGATAAVVTVTPVSADSTLFEFDVLLAGEVIGTVRWLTPAAGNSADTIAAAFREQLSATAFSALTLDSATGSPVVITGPADGRTVVLTPTADNVGNNGIVATTPAVSTHTIVGRGDKFAAESLRIGSVPTTIPHP